MIFVRLFLEPIDGLPVVVMLVNRRMQCFERKWSVDLVFEDVVDDRLTLFLISDTGEDGKDISECLDPVVPVDLERDQMRLIITVIFRNYRIIDHVLFQDPWDLFFGEPELFVDASLDLWFSLSDPTYPFERILLLLFIGDMAISFREEIDQCIKRLIVKTFIIEDMIASVEDIRPIRCTRHFQKAAIV